MFWLEASLTFFLHPLLFPIGGFASPKAESLAAQPAATSPVVYTRPAISSFSSSGTGFGESFKAESWQCDTCLLQNKVTDSKCAACQATKLSPKDTIKQTGIGTPSKSGKSAPSASGTGFGDKFKPAVGTWDCDTCLVQNKSEAVKCVACETPKPGTGVQRVLTLTVASESAVTVAASTSSCTVTTGTLGFADKFKQPVGSWECPVCCVFNNADDNKCVSCMSEKPGTFMDVWNNLAHYFNRTFKLFSICWQYDNNLFLVRMRKRTTWII